MQNKEAPEPSKAMQYMIERKKVVRQRNKLSFFNDQDEWKRLDQKADELMKKADDAGGLSVKESYGLMVH